MNEYLRLAQEGRWDELTAQGVQFGGEAIQDFATGWALMFPVGKCAHYWEEDTTTMPPTIGPGGRRRYYVSLCGVGAVACDALKPFGLGNFPRCKRCLRKGAPRG
jgi:hypothetical protein